MPARSALPAQAPALALATQPTGKRSRPAGPQPIPAMSSRPAAAPAQNGQARLQNGSLRALREMYGDAWSFDILGHSFYGNSVEVVGELRANGATARESVTLFVQHGRSHGELLERAAYDTLCKCAEALTRNGH